MERRLIFPTAMFVLAGVSFAFGIWQYIYAGQVKDNADQRMAFIAQTIQGSRLSQANKKNLYASIFEGLPTGPSLFGFELSGSFASQSVTDGCTNDGQRTICRALIKEDTAASTLSAICGVCRPD